jgi:asparagine synthase (glutamine-hydrolysing)
VVRFSRGKSTSDSLVFNERKLKDNINFIDPFYELILKNIKLSLTGLTKKKFACELSGGLDSAIVALATTNVSNSSLKTFGMKLPNYVGEQQKERRDELINSFDFIDTFVEIEKYGPLNNDGYSIKYGLATLNDEIYHDALRFMTHNIANQGYAILTGLGGDELAKSFKTAKSTPNENDYLNYKYINNHKLLPGIEKSKYLPFPAIYISMILASQSRSPVFLRQGIWPIEPLCDSNIIRFCQFLPEEIKKDKKIHRLLLSKHGVSNNFLYPKTRENFTEVFEHNIKHHNRKNILALMNKSKLHELGYINKEVFIESYDNYCISHETKINPIVFYIIPAIEYTLINIFGI